MTKIVIVGGGTAGWITASILAKGLNKEKFQITLVESPDIPTIGVGEATIPPITQLCAFLEIDETELLKAISGTYKYGIHFEGWSANTKSYMHAFGFLGTSYGNISFPQMWLNYQKALDLPPLMDFIPSSVAAYKNKFSHPYPRPNNAKVDDYYPLSELFYAYQFDASLLAKYLKNYAIGLGVRFIADTVDSIHQKDNGEISHVQLNSNGLLHGNYLVDCTGAKSLINKQTLNSKFISWSQYLPCDRAIAVQTEAKQPPFPYTKSIAMNAGWRWQIPLQHRVGNGYVYASQFCTLNEATRELENALNGQNKITDIKSMHFETGYLKTPWNKNSIAIGLSSGFLEPLESTSIHITHKFALELMNAFRFGDNMEEEAARFNQKFVDDLLLIRDFIIMHYHTAQNRDSAFWRVCSEMAIPDSLHCKLDEFKNTGYITLPKTSLFPYQSWLQVLIGQDIFPTQLANKAPKMTQEKAIKFFQTVNQTIKQQVIQLPSYQTYLNNLSSE
ncbi:tryptophan halogenase family protein [Paraglaciecola sp.]|uniref:tryptophan halogenase family protein n=1 Tax=Paraglaciecola sp. TaxID=1920173 RepID=UPI003EFB3AE8